MAKSFHQKTYTVLIALALAVVGACLAPSSVRAAALSLSTGQGYAIGQTFSVKVLVSTAAGESINAVSANVSFSPGQLQLVSISKVGSVIGIWAAEPTYSNSSGTASLEGIILNPGFSGQGATVATLNFKVKAAGVTSISFAQASVLANDGQGTNVLTAAPSKSIYLGAAAPENATTEENVPAGAPSAPVVVSTTNPDPAKWYNDPNPTFSWNVPAGVTSVRLQYDKSPVATPGVVYTPAISEKKLSKLQDGVFYFHAQFRNEKGWGATAHFRFNIDTVAPVPFAITEAHPANTDDPRPILYFNTTDDGSGVDHYDVKIGNNDFLTVAADTVSSNPYTPPQQEPGTKTVVVNAYDEAGNKTTASMEIDIQAIIPPVIDDYQSEMEQGDMLRIQGHTFTDSTVTIRVKDQDGVESSDTSPSNQAGKFVITWSKMLDPGVYTFTASVTNDKGATSPSSESYTVVVREKTIYRIGSLVINYLSIVFLVIGLITLFILFIMYCFHKIAQMRRKVHRAVKSTEQTLHKRFIELQADMANHIAMIESAESNRALTREEKLIRDSLRKSLAAAEHDISQTLGKLEDEAEHPFRGMKKSR